LVASLFAVNLAGYLDPLSFLYRSFAVYFTSFPDMAFSETASLAYSLGLESLGQTLGQALGNLALNSFSRMPWSSGCYFWQPSLLMPGKKDSGVVIFARLGLCSGYFPDSMSSS